MPEYENLTKKHIREVALELFKQKSFDEITINEICNNSGIKKQTFYYYFKSKDALLESFYEIPNEISALDLSLIMEADSYVEQLWILNKKQIDFISNSGTSIVKQLFIKNISNDVGTFKITEDQKKLFKTQISIIEKGQQAGQFLNKTDPKVLLILLRQSIHGTSFIWTVHNGNFDYINTVRYLFESIFDVANEYRKVKNFDFCKMWDIE